MIKPNWKIFKAKFSENPQNNFEWFCYLLFCNEFEKKHGISRYKNQSAIETNPIESGKDIIGWQAKFYDSSLSYHKQELDDTLVKLRRDYSNITKLYIYSNQEWGQNKGQKPQGLIDIENRAKELDVLLEWRTASYFESDFVSVENEIISKHFFTFEKSIFTLIEQLRQHTENILRYIQTSISYNGHSFEIDRTQKLEQLIDKSEQISILSGVGGVGKTVLIKKMYEQFKDEIPFYVFKASEFELRNIGDLFIDFSFYDFANAHRDFKGKTIVIDSSEKLLELKSIDPFKEFLSVIIKDGWKVIFTTRDSYLEDLNYQFFEIYNIAPLNIGINNLELMELDKISEEYSFILPKDEKLLELIRNPFYLNEYLKFYTDVDELNYTEFKAKLWNQKIKKSKPERERCFLKIAFERANTGQFFINPNCESNILNNELIKDEILGYEEPGYFITHDIYEEWALEKIINSEFIKKLNEQYFFKKIGKSLPIRRSFRNWLSEKLLLENNEIKEFIEAVIESKEIEPFWKDEIFVSVLLSNYSKAFFGIFKDELLADECKLLKKLTFILRIACKEVDDDFLKQLGLKNLNLFSLEYILTKPKGQGWKCLINFVYDNIETIGIKNINFILPVIHDWNNKVKEGETTKFSSLIALKFYQWIINEKVYYSHDNTRENLIRTILYGASEIKDELKNIFKEILENKWKNYRDPYYDLSKFVLTNLEGVSVSKVLPGYVLKLADLFWSYTPKREGRFHHSRTEIEQYFGLESNHSDYYPASAYQTPIYWLLKFNLKETIDFILEFTNKSVKSYAILEFDRSVQTVEIYINEKNIKKQYISNCLWNLYRGTGSPRSPYLLQSIHMALEKFFLEIGENAESRILESWLIYLLEHSESASISSVVTSIVLAYPEKTFNVAKILFKTKEFIIQDTHRSNSEQSAKSLYSIGQNWDIDKNKFYDQERIKSCDDKHRKWNLEYLFLNYQVFRREEISEEESQNRQKILWEILDNYYKELLPDPDQTESDKTWRLFLARMDRRKMNITTEKIDEGILIQFEPETEPDIKEYREETQKKYEENMKYISLKLWSEFKSKNDDKYKKYEKYESNPEIALKEVKNIVEELGKIDAPDYFKMQCTDEENFYLFNHSIPPYVCSVLIENDMDKLSDEDKLFCKDVVIDVANSALHPNYMYQLGDGIQPAISSLPTLLKFFPKEKEDIKTILLFTLFKEESVGGFFLTERFNIFSIAAIHRLWKQQFDDAQSLLLGYLLFKPKYDKLVRIIEEESYRNGNYNPNYGQLLERFITENEDVVYKMINNELFISDLGNIEEYDFSTLISAFKIMPHKTNKEEHMIIADKIISSFSKTLKQNDRFEEIDFSIKHDFYKKYAFFVLNLSFKEIPKFIKPVLDNLESTEIADILEQFIWAEDILNRYNNFWFIWNKIKEKVFNISKEGNRGWYFDKIIKSYLFAQVPWKKTAKEWHSLKDNNKRFFKEVSYEIGHYPSVLYAISKLLNDVGSSYIDDGIIWISNILSKNPDYVNKELETSTIYYIENLVRKYAFKERDKIKRTKELKHKLIIILNFLIDKGSTVGYMLRENVV